MTQLARLLGLGITDSAIEKWENNQNRPTESHRQQIVKFLGFDPARANPTAFPTRAFGSFLSCSYRDSSS
jgi:transcriptional regulator with XRE-family HTH domain